MLANESMHIVSLALCIRCAQCIANIKSDTHPDLMDILDMDGPDQNYYLDKIEQEFAWVTNGTVRCCVGAIDGVAIRIRRPLSSDNGLFGRVDRGA